MNVTPLLRELILHTIDVGMLNRAIPAHARLIGVLIDQLAGSSTMPLQLPRPSDPRAVKVAALLAANPKRGRSLPALAKASGAVPERSNGCSAPRRT